MMPQGWEWVILALVALVLFGGSRLAGIGKNAGKAIREFKEETTGHTGKDSGGNPAVGPAPTGQTPATPTGVVDAETVEPERKPGTEA
jgi:sec-independent protein translocase protein TatA